MHSVPPVRLALAVCRTALCSALVLVAIAAIACPAAAVVAYWSGTPGLTGPAIMLGVVCALVCCLFVAVFHISRETMQVPVEDGPAFTHRLRTLLEGMGYVVTESDDGLIGRPAFSSFLFGGAIAAKLGRASASLTGPRVYLHGLRKPLRLHTLLEQVPKALAIRRHRRGGRMLREAEVRVHVPAEMLPEACRQVALLVPSRGTDLECEIRVIMRSEKGFSEHYLDETVRSKLAAQGMPVEIDKQPLPLLEGQPWIMRERAAVV